jgi:hypothetical protein
VNFKNQGNLKIVDDKIVSGTIVIDLKIDKIINKNHR